MIEYQSRFKRHLELWFDMAEPQGEYDVVIRCQTSSPPENGHVTDFYNLHVDLSRDVEDLLRGLSGTTRRGINKSLAGDDIRIEYFTHPTLEVVEQFTSFYGRFAATKGLPELYDQRLLACMSAGLLTLSRAMQGDETLIWHASIMYGTRASLMHTASLFRECGGDERKFLGRVSRRLQWEDFLHFKRRGVVTYDMGGWYEGNTCQERLRINRFKEGFGGTKVREYCGVELRSPLAKFTNVVRSGGKWGRMQVDALRDGNRMLLSAAVFKVTQALLPLIGNRRPRSIEHDTV